MTSDKEEQESTLPPPPPFFLHVSASEQDLLEAISLTPPVESPDGSFFLGIVSSSGSGGACHVQTPWCTTTSKGSKPPAQGRSSELVFQRQGVVGSDEFTGFLDTLRDAAVTKLFGSQGEIFEEEVSREDIDANFVPPGRTSRAVLRLGVLDEDLGEEGEEGEEEEEGLCVTEDRGRMQVSLHIAGINISGTRISLEFRVKRPQQILFEADLRIPAAADEEKEPQEVVIITPCADEGDDGAGGTGSVLRLTDRRNVHLQMYREAKSNAEKLREKALMAYLELLRVRDVYCIAKDSNYDMNNSDSDIDEIEFI